MPRKNHARFIPSRKCSPTYGLINNLRDVGETIVYLPYYMPTDNPKFGWKDEALLDEGLQIADTSFYYQKIEESLRASALDGRWMTKYKSKRTDASCLR
jgi:hypothetical protein